MAGPRIVNTLWPNWEDATNGQAQTGWTTQDQAEEPTGPYTGLLDAAANIADPGLMNATFQRRMLVETPASVGDYPSVRDQVVDGERQLYAAARNSRPNQFHIPTR